MVEVVCMKIKKFSKKTKIIILIVSIIILIIGAILLTLFILNKEQKKKIDSFTGFTFKEIETLNYGNYNLEDFLDDKIKCNENKCTLYNEKIDYEFSEVTNLGNQDFTLTITYNGKNYTKTYNLNIVDTEKPVIILSTEKTQVLLNSEFNSKEYLKNVEDNYDKNLIDSVIIEGQVDTNTLGEYKVIYKVSDSSNNVDTKELIVNVVEEIKKEENTDSSSNSNDKNDKNDRNDKNDKNDKSSSDGNNSSSNNNQSNNDSDNNQNNNSSNNSSNNSFKSKVNSIGLNPVYTRYTSFDNQISGILMSITNSSMTNYDKLMSIYNYVQDKLYYAMPLLDMNLIYNLQLNYHYSEFDATEIALAQAALDNGYGVCDSYAALFMIMTRQAGFDSYVFNGQVSKVGGGTTGHAWVVINIGGTYYTFDPQIEDYGTTDTYFGKTSDELNIYSYSFNDNINRFNYFKETNPTTTSINITGLFNHSDSITTYLGDSKEASVVATLGGNNTINMNVKVSGIGSYSFAVNVSKDGGAKQNIHSSNDNNNNVDVSYTFKEAGSYDIEISTYDYGVQANNLYYLHVTIKNPESTTPLTDFTCDHYEVDNYEKFTFTPIGGIGVMDYNVIINETDDANIPYVPYSNGSYLTYGNSAREFYLYFTKGKYYKIALVVTDGKGNRVKKDIVVQK